MIARITQCGMTRFSRSNQSGPPQSPRFDTMKTAIMKLASAIVGLTACLSATAAATNALFLPVDAKPFGSLAANAEYNAREQTNAIRSGECKPADQDPEGHWGKVVNGFQLSIRSATNAFVRGHPATVTVLLRNSTTNALQSLGGYYVATVFLTDGAGHERQATPLGSFSGPMSATIPGMRQLKDTITLRAYPNRPAARRVMSPKARCNMPI